MLVERRAHLHRPGLTLMELVVVLVILVALAGVVLPLLPNLLTKAHDATVVTNIAELNKAIMSYQGVNLKYPDMFDSIVDSGGNVYAGAIFGPSGPNGAMATFTFNGATGPVFTLGQLTAGQAQSLTFAGINNLVVMAPPPITNATFNAYIGPPNAAPTTAPVQSGAKVLFADNNYIFQKLNMQQKMDSTGTLASYVVFALGPYCTIVGATSFGIFDAPVSFGEHDIEQPAKSLARMLVVFRVYQDGTRAEYVGCAHPDVTGLGTASMHVQEFYNN